VEGGFGGVVWCGVVWCGGCGFLGSWFGVWGLGFVGYVGKIERGEGLVWVVWSVLSVWVVGGAINRTIGKIANRVGCFVGKVSRHNGIKLHLNESGFGWG
jgi:hypothetical protein